MSRFPQADKKFGQHFLHSPHVIRAITSDIPPLCDGIIEVGPGPAVLTPHLMKHELPVYVIEMDKRFTETLSSVVGEDHLTLGDALNINWHHFLESKNIKQAWLVSNLPYNVSVPLTLAFMRCPQIIRMTLMYQKEVAEKFFPRTEKNSMSSLKSFANLFFKTSRLIDVPPGAFQPPPKVMSQVLRFDRLTHPQIDINKWDQIEFFLRSIFQNRRKQLRGLIKELIPQQHIDRAWITLQLPEGIRAEALNMSQLYSLWELYETQGHHTEE